MATDEFEIPEEMKAAFELEIRREVALQPLFDHYELSLFKWHLTETESLHKRMYKKALDYIHEQVDRDVEIVNDSGVLPVEYFYRRARYSDVVYMVSLLESLLEGACDRLKHLLPKSDIAFDLEDIKGTKWTAPQKFLKRYGQIEHSDTLWEPIETLIFVRNRIVHDNGSVEDVKEKERARFSKREGLAIKDDRIDIASEYIVRSIQDLERLVEYYEEGIRSTIKLTDSKR